MKNLKLAILILFILIGTLVSCESEGITDNGSNINDSVERNVGKECVVQFKRDILGQSAELPTPANTESINGAEVQLTGKYLGVSDEWVIIEQDGEEIWIYKPNILYLKFK